MPEYSTASNREWWAQRWIDHLESFGRMPRLARARNYAREGNVVKLEFTGAKVMARVQGTAPEPYKVSLSLDLFDEEQWDYVIESMSEQAVFSAKLLAGEMPHNIEDVFTANGLSLFPLTKFDIHSKCSCPDKANPCKHIGAVYYLLGDRFSDDPFVLFQLRGRTKADIIQALRDRRTHRDAETIEPDAESLSNTPGESDRSLLETRSFWQYPNQLESSLVVIAPSVGNETVLDTLGPLPLKIDVAGGSLNVSQALMEELRGIYTQVSQQAALDAMMSGQQDTEN
jgi:uncharacterized Zn finger protein